MARILLIDDETPIRHALRRTLSKAGHTVIEAPNGQIGLDLFHQHAPDLVLTDLLMPERDGIETIRALRQVDPYVRIIAMSGGGCWEAMRDMALTVATFCGAARTLAKPFTPQELLGAVSAVLSLGA